MRNVKYLIEEIREATENQDVSEFTGIKDREFLRYLNDAQERIQSEIVKKSPKVFTKEVIIDLDGSEYYDLPYDIFMGNKITDVKYRYTPSSYWERMEPDYVNNRDDIDLYDTSPDTYIRLSGKIALRPRPRRGQVRITYVASIPKIDLSRAEVTAATIVAGGITSITIDNTTADFTELERDSYFSLVNRHGDIIQDQIKFDSIDQGTGVVTLSSTVDTDKDVVDLVGSFVVLGKKASTHSALDEVVERYIMAYTKMKIFQRDGSAEFQIQAELVQTIEAEIIDSYAGISDDILRIPDIDRDFDEF